MSRCLVFRLQHSALSNHLWNDLSLPIWARTEFSDSVFVVKLEFEQRKGIKDGEGGGI